MIELKQVCLVFSFPEVHPDATLQVNFQRTLRIPDDDQEYPLPPGLGSFPLRHLDDLPGPVPAAWRDCGGVALPMYQGEALWISLLGSSSYPFCVKVGTGLVNAVTGDPWLDKPDDDPQDYLVTPEQPWLDGYSIERGLIRQFVAMPLGSGHGVEEQLTGEARYGGLQIAAWPMKREVYEKLPRHQYMQMMLEASSGAIEGALPTAMGLAAGGRMRQEIYEDPHGKDAWCEDVCGRCFIHIANSAVWRVVAGEEPPTEPPTAKDYTEAGLPWFDYYSDDAALEGSDTLARVKSVQEIERQKGAGGLPGNDSLSPVEVVELRRGLTRDQVREWPGTGEKG